MAAEAMHMVGRVRAAIIVEEKREGGKVERGSRVSKKAGLELVEATRERSQAKKKKKSTSTSASRLPAFPSLPLLVFFLQFPLSLSLLALLPHRHLQSNPHGLSPNSTLKEEEEEEEEEEMKDSPPPRRGLAATTAAKTAPSLEPPTPACASPPSGGE